VVGAHIRVYNCVGLQITTDSPVHGDKEVVVNTMNVSINLMMCLLGFFRLPDLFAIMCRSTL
jgi:hypothetical protein